jgi:hypothetical protein
MCIGASTSITSGSVSGIVAGELAHPSMPARLGKARRVTLTKSNIINGSIFVLAPPRRASLGQGGKNAIDISVKRRDTCSLASAISAGTIDY